MMGIFLGIIFASYVLAIGCLTIWGLIVAIIGSLRNKAVRLGLNDFVKSKGFIISIIFIPCCGSACAAFDLLANKLPAGLSFYALSVVAVILYLCGLITYYIFRNDK